ncbi:MAG: hypothetical protein JNK05_20160 [Myxococcales bacterium]|nr:hypothetical protein [Myxococcales bacterium]
MRSNSYSRFNVAAWLVSSALVAAPSAFAQTTALAINAGFSPDPGMVRGVAGGPVAAARIGPECRGYFPQRPQHRITTAGLQGVRFFTVAADDADITLAIVGPNNTVYCDDDRGGNNQPMLDLRLPAGSYDVYVGTYRESEQIQYGLVYTTNNQLRPNAVRFTPQGSTPTRPNTPPNNGSSPWNNPQNTTQTPAPAQNPALDRAAAMRPSGPAVRIAAAGTQRARSRTGGSEAASDLQSGCAGFINRAPSHAVVVQAAGLPLRFNVTSAADTTLLVRAPNGQVQCNDDANGNFNPEVFFNASVTGSYAVWVGTYRPGLRNLYQLSVTTN